MDKFHPIQKGAEMKTVICTGDSHTWGQGASELLDFLTRLLLEVISGWHHFTTVAM